LAAAACLVVWAAAPSLFMSYAMWAGLGVCMASTLYEPAFAVVGHGVPHVSERLRALALITIFGGLASTAFLPLTALLEVNIGWRGTVLALAGAMTVSALVVWRAVPRTDNALPPGSSPPIGDAPSAAPPGFGIVLAAFGSASLAHAALTTTLVPALAERRLSTTTAALLGGSMGLMQLPGRALMMHGRLSASPSALLITSLALQGIGMALLAAAGSALAIGLGVAVFAGGAGLATLVRPYLVQTAFAMARAGYLNGRLARVMQLARAGGPIAAVAIGSSVGYRWLYGVLALHFAGLAFAWRQSRRETRYP
jgi:predicted MFS family arabinose efflux permease